MNDVVRFGPHDGPFATLRDASTVSDDECTADSGRNDSGRSTDIERHPRRVDEDSCDRGITCVALHCLAWQGVTPCQVRGWVASGVLKGCE